MGLRSVLIKISPKIELVKLAIIFKNEVKNFYLLLEFSTLPGPGVVGGLQLINLRIVLGISVPHDLVFINECPLLVGEVSVEILLPQ